MRRKKCKIHLICNAHLDPVWQWEWEEGVAEALSTFRTAADICEEYENFVFNHNEAVLYMWIQKYDPELFGRIQSLVKDGKWNIMGGWYLQPDCNLPSGESFVRQILVGKTYFKKYFGISPKTAINFDSFGHSRGLVQILAKSGFDSYMIGRPWQEFCKLDSDDFIWVGYDGSEIKVTRFARTSDEMYNNILGEAREKIERYLTKYNDRALGLILWGVGNHGGGPSRKDMKDISELIDMSENFHIVHSTPERYFSELDGNNGWLPKYLQDLNPWAVGCYSSMIRVKQLHRKLENELYSLEKMAACAFTQKLAEYPRKDINDAILDLMFSQFHDILSGACTQIAEEASLRRLNHGLEIISREKLELFIALTSGQKKADPGQIPIFVYNPHPYDWEGPIECELTLESPSLTGTFRSLQVYQNEKKIPSQIEQEHSNCSRVDWRKRLVFYGKLQASKMNRFDCVVNELANTPPVEFSLPEDAIVFKTDKVEISINKKTGFVDRYCVRGVNYISKNSFLPLVISDSEDSWEQLATRFDSIAGYFTLMSPEMSASFCGLRESTLAPVRVIEDGEVRMVVEALFSYGHSFICQRYILNKLNPELGIEIRVFWNEKNSMLKLSVPVFQGVSRYIGQVPYGVHDFPMDGSEIASQKWIAVISEENDKALTCVNNSTYASDFSNGILHLTLLRSPAYCCGPQRDGKPPLIQDRFSPRHDQGERMFNFWFRGGKTLERLNRIEREAMMKNEVPYALSCFPSGKGQLPQSFIKLTDEIIQLSAMKLSEEGERLILRLFEPTDSPGKTTIVMPYLNISRTISFKPFEIKTLMVDLQTRNIYEADLLENKLSSSRIVEYSPGAIRKEVLIEQK